jgi:predicted acylesterase/phospholipase RssA
MTLVEDHTNRVEARAGSGLQAYRSIGIILAGGGAKGAYQAGALKAIHGYLRQHGALGKVRMIAGTSIGSWNAMFWLAGLVEREGSPGPDLESWWSGISLWRLVRPILYIPGLRNYLLTSRPWQRAFDQLFQSDSETAERLRKLLDGPDHNRRFHFYFTRSNVERARLEVTTNRDLSAARTNLPTKQWRTGTRRVEQLVARTIDDLRTAVFSSMDMPPLFQYMKIQDSYYEDGGVIDNLPIQFGTEAEHCDLLFIIPLNANFAQPVSMRSIIKRVFRVIDVRQGVLERNSFKMIYLYNELAALRHKTEMLEGLMGKAHERLTALFTARDTGIDTEVKSLLDKMENAAASRARAATAEDADLADRALMRRHQHVQVFAICPAPKLAINTTEFWKRKAAGRAFRLMQKATAEELEKFFADPPKVIRMALVQPTGDVVYVEEF